MDILWLHDAARYQEEEYFPAKYRDYVGYCVILYTGSVVLLGRIFMIAGCCQKRFYVALVYFPILLCAENLLFKQFYNFFSPSFAADRRSASRFLDVH